MRVDYFIAELIENIDSLKISVYANSLTNKVS